MTVFDMDSHLREEYFLDEVYRLEAPFAHLTPVRLNQDRSVRSKFRHELSPWPSEVGRHFDHSIVYDESANWNGGEIARRQVGGYDMARRIADNDKEGVDVQFLFPTQIGIPTYAEGALGSALCHAYNGWVKRLVAGYDERLWPVGMVPWGHPEGMVAELQRCVKELGFKAIHLTPYTHKHTIDDHSFEPFYAEAARLDVPLMLHPNSYGELINRYDNFFAMHVLGRPFNCTAGLVALVTGGVFERHPGLRVAFFECSAEWILYWMHRMDDDYRRMKNGFAPKITRAPSDYVRRNCYVTCEADERLLAHALEEFSEDRVLLATDYPHFDSEYPGTLHELLRRTDITQKQKDKIVSGNAREFLQTLKQGTTMKIETLTYSDGQTTFQGYLADPEGSGRRPGVLIAHEAPGLNDHPKRRARMIAELGYVCLAADLYGDGRVAQKPEDSQTLMAPLREDVPKLRRHTRAGFDALTKLRNVDPGRIGAMGYCFGGLAVLELARMGAPLAGVVSFHGILSTKTPEDAKNVTAKLLVCTGSDDPLVPPEQIAGFEQEMTKAGVDWQVVTYGGAKHAFTNPDANRPPVLQYNASADARSWEAMQGFWFELFGKP